ncbi:MAG: hypothetical protein Q9160_000949 [Pyrenula sp. 1 TL-2023]
MEEDIEAVPELLPDPGSAGLDPFQTSPPTRIEDADVFMNHYLEKRRFEKGVDQRWRLAMRECIRLLRERIDDPMCQDISDETIVSVAILAAVERSDSTRIAMVLAIDIGSTPSSPSLSYSNSPTPYLENPFPCLDIDESQLLPEMFSPTDLESAGIEFPALSLLFEVRAITNNFTHAADPFPAQAFLSRFGHLCNFMRRLLSLLPPSSPPSSTSPRSPPLIPPLSLSEQHLSPTSYATLSALALYILAPLRGMHPDPDLLVSNLSLRLRHTLSTLLSSFSLTSPTASPITTPSPTPQEILLLWLTSIGATAITHNTPEREWYLGHLVALTGELGIAEWEAYKEALRKVMLCEILCEPRLPRLWREIEAKRLALAW